MQRNKTDVEIIHHDVVKKVLYKLHDEHITELLEVAVEHIIERDGNYE